MKRVTNIVNTTLKSLSIIIIVTMIIGCSNSESTTATSPSGDETTLPIANAGEDKYTVIDKNVVLDATLSSDSQNSSLTYSWKIISKPSNSIAELDDSTLPQPSFTIDKDGNYTIELIVNNGALDSLADTVTIQTMEDVNPDDEFIPPTL